MARALILAFCFAAAPAFGFLEKFLEEHMEKQSEEWKRETLETLARGEDPKERVKAAEWLSGRKDADSIAALAGALNTALMEAASKGCDRELIRTMIKADAKIDATNAAGLTPFEMGLWMGHDGLEELIAAGYRLPPAKVKGYLEGYKDRPAAQAMVKKAARK